MMVTNLAHLRKYDPFFVGFDRLWKEIDRGDTGERVNLLLILSATSSDCLCWRVRPELAIGLLSLSVGTGRR